MIFDCFSFHNELDLLDLRLHELSDVVDYFVIVEATKTHSGLDKPLYFQNNYMEFRPFLHKIISVALDDMPMTPEEIDASLSSKDREWIESGYQREDSWVRERFQRNAIMDGLKDNAYPDDVVIIEDADEMVKKEVLRDIEWTIVPGSNAVGQTLHSYYLNWKCVNMPWWGSKILNYRYITTPSEDRFHTPARRYIHDGGWHFNFLGGADAVKHKLISYAHQEFAVPEVLDNVDTLLSQQRDALGRLYKYEVVDIDDSYPEYLRTHLDRFDHLMWKGK